MIIKNKNIDGGKAFDWGKTSSDYAKYRDIYPELFYEKIVQRNLCTEGQRVLDLGTGTGVIPRNMYRYGAEWIGTDISENQISFAKQLSEENNLDIRYQVSSAEDVCFPENTFDVITACQCYWYFDYEKLMPKLAHILKPDGSLLLLCMEWLPFEDKIARESENLVLKYNPSWSGARATKEPISVPDIVYDYFDTVYREEYNLKVPFTRDSWHGRMRACRGVSASLSKTELELWDKEHKALLSEIAPDSFDVVHYAAMLELKQKK